MTASRAAEGPGITSRAALVDARRLAVVDSECTLLGLVCMKRSRSAFCFDADVASRAASVPTQKGTIA